MIIFIDTDRDSALRGQAQRKRLVRRRAFDRHWRRWSELRERILRGDSLGDGEPWGRVVLSHRDAVVDDVLGLLDTAAAVGSRCTCQDRTTLTWDMTSW